MERYGCKTMVISGEGALAALEEQKGERLLIVTAPELKNSLPLRRLTAALRCRERHFFDDISPEPTMLQALEGTRKIRELGTELVVALGGQQVMDCAKAMVCFAGGNRTLAVVPTVCGSGTEVTDRACLSHNGCRHLLRDEGMRPSLAILDRQMMEACPGREIAEGGFALLAAAVEAYSVWDGGLITDIHAREAFCAGWGALSGAVSGDPEAQRRLLAASAMVGMAYGERGLGLCHAMENSLGSMFSLSRGKLAGILLPVIIGWNAHAAGRKYAELSRVAGLGGSSEALGLKNLKNGLIRLRRELGLPGTLAQAGVNPRALWSHVQRVTQRTLEDPDCRNNPVAVDDFMIRRILEEAAGRL